jgi:hypothetical protein
MTDVLLSEIQAYLEENQFTCIPVQNPNGDFLFIDINVKGEDIRLKCTFPPSFPYTFPKIYILEEFYRDYKPLPHIQQFDRDGFICTFDTNIVFPNYYMPKEVTLECVKKAQEIILDGIDGKNHEDFKSEFIAYWELDSGTTADLIFYPKDIPMELYCYMRNDKFLYLSDDKEKLLNYLLQTKGLDIASSKLSKALYLPIIKNWCPPFPNTNGEVMEKLRGEKYFNSYLRYLRNNKQRHIVIFSQVIDGNVCLARWIHEKQRTPNGFRLSKIIPEHFYGLLYRNDKIKKFYINQLSHQRIFERGGDGKTKGRMKVSVTGCGSIGSHLTKTLIDLGINDFTLIDKDVLSADNIARHYCGASSIRRQKVIAMKENILRHYPDMSIRAIDNDVFALFETESNIFNQCDFNFVVIGNIPIENKFISLFNNGYIEKPLIIIWVEPYLVGGHAIVLQKVQFDLIDTLFDHSYKFNFNVVTDGDKYIKRESGCGNTFLPYSAFEVQHFLNSIMDYINQNIFEKGNKNNYLLSWGGRLDVARKNRMKISPQWLGEGNRKLRVKILNG